MDVDREAGALAYEEIGLEPTIIITNPENSHAHLLYELKAPVSFSQQSRTKPQQFYLAVKRGMTLALKADAGYAALVTKNPLAQRWRTTYCNVQYDLEEIAEYCEPITAYERAEEEGFGLGRNSTMFNEVRLWAYARVREFKIYEAWEQAVQARCEKTNSFTPPLSLAEVTHTARSISKWTWANRHNLGAMKNRGAAQVDKSLPVEERQRLGAEYTNRVRSGKSCSQIMQAVRSLKFKGERIGATSVAREAGVSRRTANNYRELWEQ